jgi:hypothetical protein
MSISEEKSGSMDATQTRLVESIRAEALRLYRAHDFLVKRDPLSVFGGLAARHSPRDTPLGRAAWLRLLLALRTEDWATLEAIDSVYRRASGQSLSIQFPQSLAGEQICWWHMKASLYTWAGEEGASASDALRVAWQRHAFLNMSPGEAERELGAYQQRHCRDERHPRRAFLWRLSGNAPRTITLSFVSPLSQTLLHRRFALDALPPADEGLLATLIARAATRWTTHQAMVTSLREWEPKLGGEHTARAWRAFSSGASDAYAAIESTCWSGHTMHQLQPRDHMARLGLTLTYSSAYEDPDGEGDN